MNATIEPLEARIAPAVLSGIPGQEKALIYDDFDGDVVTLTISKGVLLESDFTFDSAFETDAPQQLHSINFGDPDDIALNGTNLTIVVKRGLTGDGQVSVGFINASAITLGDVKIAGDLGKITTKFNSAPSGLSIKSLNVLSMGRAGLDSQGGIGDLASDFDGRVGTFVVRGDVVDASIAALSIKKLVIGGSLIGGAVAGSGSIVTQSEMFDVLIKGDIRGGDGAASGQLASGGMMGKVVLGGSIIGGDGGDPNGISSSDASGAIRSNFTFGGQLGSLSIGGSVTGSNGTASGTIDFGPGPGGAGSTIAIKGSLVGGGGARSASIFGGGDIKALTIGGSVIGGADYTEAGQLRGQIFAGGKIVTVTIKGDLFNNNADGGGLIKALGALGNVTIGGSFIIGNTNTSFGLSGDEIGLVKIAGSFYGGDPAIIGGAAGIRSGGNIAGVSIGGSVSNLVIAADDQVGAVTVKRGATDLTIFGRGQKVQGPTTDLAIKSVSIGGTAERVLIQGGVNLASMAVNPDAQIGTVTIGGDWIAGSIVSGIALRPGLYGDGNDSLIDPDPNAAIASRIASITIKGAIVGTSPTVNATDHFGFVAEQIGAFKAGGLVFKLSASVTDGPFLFSYPTTADVALIEV